MEKYIQDFNHLANFINISYEKLTPEQRSKIYLELEGDFYYKAIYSVGLSDIFAKAVRFKDFRYLDCNVICNEHNKFMKGEKFVFGYFIGIKIADELRNK